MKYLLTIESLTHEIDRVKGNFFDYLNKNKNWYIRRDNVSYALYEGFCRTYGYEAGDFYDKNHEFHNKYPGIFTIKNLNVWFKQWKEIELSKTIGKGKYKPSPHYLDTFNKYPN